MSRKLTDIDRLHRKLFGSVPGKAGVAYERIAAVVLAVLGWVDVVHDRTEQPDGRLTDHQLDITGRTRDGSVRRLLVECKERDEKVSQEDMLKLATVRDRIGASHAAMIAKEPFTKGARAVAVDDDIAMIRLRAYDPELDDGTWVRAVNMTLKMGFSVQEDVRLVTSDGERTAKELRVPAESWMEVRNVDGEGVGSWADLWAAGTTVGSDDERAYRQLDLDAPRLVESGNGWIPITGVRWTERTVWTEEQFSTAAKGEPRLVLQQLDADGELCRGRVIVDEKLVTWDFAPDRTVVRRLDAGV